MKYMGISKCSGEKCPIKKLCKRGTIKINPFRQWWVKGEYKDGKCALFLDKNNNGEDKEL